MERIVVEYWHDGGWVWSRDYPSKMREEALEYGRRLWRQGVAGVRITHYAPQILVEHRRSPEGTSPAPARYPRTTYDRT